MPAPEQPHDGATLIIPSIFEDWQPTLALRWRARRKTERGYPPTLEQMWACRQSGKREWRAVPTAPHDAPTTE